MATAEFAVALPALILLLGFSLGAVDATMDKLRCVDAAREAALAAARGGNGPARGRAEAPAGATVTVVTSGGVARATVVMRTSPLGTYLPGLTVTGTAVAALEPGVVS
jgi:Flp pilus assembly protein TadG